MLDAVGCVGATVTGTVTMSGAGVVVGTVMVTGGTVTGGTVTTGAEIVVD